LTNACEPITKRGKLTIPGDLQQLFQPRSPSGGLRGNALAPVCDGLYCKVYTESEWRF
jgi:hypothetical protein